MLYNFIGISSGIYEAKKLKMDRLKKSKKTIKTIDGTHEMDMIDEIER